MFRVRCPRCGKKIFEGEEERPLRLILKNYDYKCPHCGAKLCVTIEAVKIHVR